MDNTIHFCLIEIEINTIYKDIDADTTATQEGSPSPFVILCIQQNIGSNNGDTDLNDNQNH